MILTFSLDQNHFLQHQLYSASKSPRIKKKRVKTWIIVTCSILLLSLLFYQNNKTFLFYYFLTFGIITLIFYPLYQRIQYKKHYNKFIGDNYKNRFGQTENIQFTNFAIESHDITGASKINLTEIESVTETANYFYPKLKSGGNIIIPKSKITDIIQVRNELRKLCESLNILYIEDLNWRWK